MINALLLTASVVLPSDLTHWLSLQSLVFQSELQNHKFYALQTYSGLMRLEWFGG